MRKIRQRGAIELDDPRLAGESNDGSHTAKSSFPPLTLTPRLRVKANIV